MARTINFSFTQGGGSTFTSGLVTLAPTHTRTEGTTIVLPSAVQIELVDGSGSIPNVEPTPTATDGWRYQVRIEATDRRVHHFLVEVPTGTTPINFSVLPVVSSMTLPIDATGVQLEMWFASVRSHASAADTNAVNALNGLVAQGDRVGVTETDLVDVHAELDVLTPRALPPGGVTGQVLAKTANTSYSTSWIDPPEGSGASFLVLGPSDPVPTGTPNNTVILRTES